MILEHIAFFGAVAAAALVFALLEVQIEGDAGWARDLPTWRSDARWARLLFGGRPATGYHVYAHLTVLTLLHSAYVLARVPFTWETEARLAAFYIFFWILEDFLWFVVNPAYGLEGFGPRKARWHRASWWWIMPREYWIFLPIGAALYLVGA